MNPCPSEEVLSRFVDEQLAADVAAAVEGHVETCPECQAALSSLARSALPADQRGHVRAALFGTDAPSPPTIPGIELVSVIGQGAVGQVWKARQSDLGRLVAVKTLRTDLDETSFGLLRTEAEVLARLDHPNVVRVLQSGRTSDGYYFAMEYVPNGSLVEDRSRHAKLWAPRDVAKMVREAAIAVQAAHDRNVLHRDLKPGNILLTDDRTPKVADFGQAATFGRQASRTGGAVGTPCYMAPEQAAAGEVDARTDVYGLGAVLYDMLVGRPPVSPDGDTDEVLRRVRAEDPISPRLLRPAVVEDLDTICMKCLQKRPPDRYPSAQALAEDLERYLEGRPVRARPLGVVRRGLRLAKRRPALAALIASFVAVLVGSTITMTALYRRATANAALAAERLQRARDALRTVARTREQQFWFPQNIHLQDPEPIIRLYDLHAEAAADYRDDPEAWHDTAYAMLQLAEMLAQYRPPAEVIPRVELARDELQRLTAAFPDRPKYRLGYAEATISLSSWHEAAGDDDRVRPLREEALSVTDRLLAEVPDSDHTKNVHAAFAEALGSFELRHENWDRAEELLVEAVRLNRATAAKYPTDPVRHQFLTNALWSYGRLLRFHYHDPDRYVAVLAEIVRSLTAVRAAAPARVGQYRTLLDAYSLLAQTHQFCGRSGAAAAALADGLALARDVERENPAYPEAAAYTLAYLVADGQRLRRTDPAAAAGRDRELRAALDAALARMPTSELLKMWDGVYHLDPPLPGAKDPAKAVEILRPLARGKPPGSGPAYWLRVALYEAGDCTECRALPDPPTVAGEHTPHLLRAGLLWRAGERDKARAVFRTASAAVRADFAASPTDVHYHDAVWAMIQGTAPPRRPEPLPTRTETPLLFR
jgi:hypothetical protein